MKIVVLAGGLSTERQVSLTSGTGVCRALRQRGHQAILVDMFLGLEDYTGSLADIFDAPDGLCGVIAAKMRGATRIIAMSRHEDRAALAREFGATDIVPERGQEAIDKVLEMTGGYGADAVLECVGSKQSFDTAIGLIRRGGVIGRVGLPHDVEISAEGTFYGNIGIKGGPAPVRHYDIDGGLLDAVLKGEINPGRVFTAEYDLDHIQDAYEAMDQRKVIKALIRF